MNPTTQTLMSSLCEYGTSLVYVWDDVKHVMDVAQRLSNQFQDERFIMTSDSHESLIWLVFQPGKCQDLLAILRAARTA